MVFFAVLGIFSNYFELSANAAQGRSDSNVKIIGVNLWYKNENTNEMESFFENEDADILMLTELTESQYASLDGYFSSQYPYEVLQIQSLSKPYIGKAIFSKFPLTKVEIEDKKNAEVFLLANANINNSNLDLLMVHTTAPINPSYYAQRNNQLDFLQNDLAEFIKNPAVITGDFNTSPWTAHFIEMDRSLSAQNFQRVRNNSFVFSWQYQGLPRLKSHIDHTYLTSGIEKPSYELKDFPGSDHKAQVITLSVF